MPRRLLDRCPPDSIREFRLAATQRYDDGITLAASGRRTGAIYLWGYAAEMTVKAAYFALLKLGESTTITWKEHRKPAIQLGRESGVHWPGLGEGHNIRAWPGWLIRRRGQAPDTEYPAPFSVELLQQGLRFESLWRETLRYRKNNAYTHELNQVRTSTEWYLVHTDLS